MECLERDPVVQPGAPTALMVIDAGNAPVKQGVLFDKRTVFPTVVLEEVECIGDSHRNGWGKA